MTTLPQNIKEETLSTYQQILRQGREQGIEQGIEQNRIESARNMIAINLSDSDIMKSLNVSQEFIDDVRKDMKAE